MALLNLKKHTAPIEAKIQQRRLQILIHSYLYYDKNVTLVSDEKWSKWAMELVQLQRDYPLLASQGKYAVDFKDFDGSTGFHLNFRDNYIVATAEHLYKYVMEKGI